MPLEFQDWNQLSWLCEGLGVCVCECVMKVVFVCARVWVRAGWCVRGC